MTATRAASNAFSSTAAAFWPRTIGTTASVGTPDSRSSSATDCTRRSSWSRSHASIRPTTRPKKSPSAALKTGRGAMGAEPAVAGVSALMETSLSGAPVPKSWARWVWNSRRSKRSESSWSSRRSTAAWSLSATAALRRASASWIWSSSESICSASRCRWASLLASSALAMVRTT